MRDGDQALANLPDEIKREIQNRYKGLEEFYFEVYYNRYQHYHAYKASDSEEMRSLDERLFEIENYLEELGVADGHDITNEISSDYTEDLAKMTTNRLLSEAGLSEDQIKEFIAKRLG